MNIMKLAYTVVLCLVETILNYFFELGWLVSCQHFGVGARKSQPANDSKDHNARQCTTRPKHFNIHTCLPMLAYIMEMSGFS